MGMKANQVVSFCQAFSLQCSLKEKAKNKAEPAMPVLP